MIEVAKSNPEAREYFLRSLNSIAPAEPQLPAMLAAPQITLRSLAKKFKKKGYRKMTRDEAIFCLDFFKIDGKSQWIKDLIIDRFHLPKEDYETKTAI